MKKNIIIFILLIILTLLIITACSNNINFDSYKWKNWKEQESNWNMRWDMSDDLIDNYLNVGMTESEVFQLLGGYEQSLDTNSNYRINYTLGPCRRGIDYGTLTIHFENHKLKSIERRCN